MATADVFQSQTRVDHSWEVFNIPDYVAPHPQAEIAVGYEDCGQAMVELVDLVHTQNIAVNHIVEVRYSNTMRTMQYWMMLSLCHAKTVIIALPLL